MCDCAISCRSSCLTPAYQTFSGYTTIIGPWPHCEKQPALLIRTSPWRPALTTSPRRYFTKSSTLAFVGQSSPLVHTNTWTSYWPISRPRIRVHQRRRLRSEEHTSELQSLTN